MKFNGETNVKEIALSNSAARNILEDAGIENRSAKPALRQKYPKRKF